MRRARGLIGPLVAFVAAAAAARLLLDVVEVRGRSMAPALLPGDRLVVMRWFGAPRPATVVLAADPRWPRRELIKRVASVDAHGVWLVGDNSDASADARTFGALPSSAVRWRAILRYWPPDRVGFVE